VKIAWCCSNCEYRQIYDIHDELPEDCPACGSEESMFEAEELPFEEDLPAVVEEPTSDLYADRHVDESGREFDRTSLKAQKEGYMVHRDYAAHFFRWSWLGRHFNDRANNWDVLEVGCGVDCPLVRLIKDGTVRKAIPRSYLGVDLNQLVDPPKTKWANFQGSFNFIERHNELGRVDAIVNLEVIEHMTREHGEELLVAMRDHLRDASSTLFLSTPVFNGKAAANHIHEYTIPQLRGLIEKTGYRVEKRFGTFANLNDLKRVASPQELKVLEDLRVFHSPDVVACFLAPLYPDASRNNMWVLKRA
jgi:hypothetical protein